MPLLAPGELGEAGYPAGLALGPWPIDVGELRLDRVDEYGGQWNVTEFAGKGGPPQAIEVNQRQAGHGAWIGGRFWAAKPYTISGAYEGDTPADRWAAEQRLLGACGLDGALMVTHEETPRQAWVIPNGDPVIDAVNEYAFTFQLPLLAPDPFRYGTTEQAEQTQLPATAGGLVWPATWPATWNAVVTSGRIDAHNAGNESAHPLLRVHGPLPDFTLVNQDTGQALTVDNPDGATLAAGEFIDVDTARRRVLLMGTGSRRSWMSGQWFAFVPGLTQLGFSSSQPNTTALLVATWRDTYR